MSNSDDQFVLTRPEGGVAAFNRQAWDRLARQKHPFTRPARDDEVAEPKRLVDAQWLPSDLRGRRVLCLAAGGGRHGPLYATLGAIVTVVDISPAQLQLDREVAAERQLALRTVEASMEDLSMFAPGEFEIVIHPVSTCYLPNIRNVYEQVARVTAPRGIYISQHKQPTSLQASTQPEANRYALVTPYYTSDPLPPVTGSLHREAGTLEFLHRWEQLLGDLCRCGFLITDVTEPCHAHPQAPIGSFAQRSCYAAPYVRIRAQRRSDSPLCGEPA